MVNVQIKIGNCGCFFAFPHPIAKFCHVEQAIILGRKCTEKYVEPSINHETIHAVIDKLDTINCYKINCPSRQFDNLFPKDEDSVSENGLPKSIEEV